MPDILFSRPPDHADHLAIADPQGEVGYGHCVAEAAGEMRKFQHVPLSAVVRSELYGNHADPPIVVAPKAQCDPSATSLSDSKRVPESG